MINKFILFLKKKHIIHSWKFIKHETTKKSHVGFGFSGCEMPGLREVEQCAVCSKIKKTSLNLCMSDEYMKSKYDYLWR